MAVPVTAILSVWAAGLEKFINIFEERINKGEDAIDAALCTIREVSRRTGRSGSKEMLIRLNGTRGRAKGYSQSPHYPRRNRPFLEPKTSDMLEDMGIFKKKRWNPSMS